MRFLLVRSSKYNILYTQSNYQAKYFLRHIGTQSIDTFNSSLSRQKISSSNQFFFFNYYTTQTHLKSNVEFLFPVYFLGNPLGSLKIPAFHSVLLSSKIYEEGRFQNSEFRDTIIVTGLVIYCRNSDSIHIRSQNSNTLLVTLLSKIRRKFDSSILMQIRQYR